MPILVYKEGDVQQFLFFPFDILYRQGKINAPEYVNLDFAGLAPPPVHFLAS